MTENKALALHLADALDYNEFDVVEDSQRTAAELRRLYQENEEDQGVIAVWRGRTQRAEAQCLQLQEENERLREIVNDFPLIETELSEVSDRLFRAETQRDQLLEALIRVNAWSETLWPGQQDEPSSIGAQVRAAMKAAEEGK